MEALALQGGRREKLQRECSKILPQDSITGGLKGRGKPRHSAPARKSSPDAAVRVPSLPQRSCALARVPPFSRATPDSFAVVLPFSTKPGVHF